VEPDRRRGSDPRRSPPGQPAATGRIADRGCHGAQRHGDEDDRPADERARARALTKNEEDPDRIEERFQHRGEKCLHGRNVLHAVIQKDRRQADLEDSQERQGAHAGQAGRGLPEKRDRNDERDAVAQEDGLQRRAVLLRAEDTIAPAKNIPLRIASRFPCIPPRVRESRKKGPCRR